MKLNSAKNNPQVKPFISDGKLHIEAHHTDGKITDFHVEYKGKKFHAKVENFDMLAAWKKVELFLKPL